MSGGMWQAILHSRWKRFWRRRRRWGGGSQNENNQCFCLQGLSKEMKTKSKQDARVGWRRGREPELLACSAARPVWSTHLLEVELGPGLRCLLGCANSLGGPAQNHSSTQISPWAKWECEWGDLPHNTGPHKARGAPFDSLFVCCWRQALGTCENEEDSPILSQSCQLEKT